MTDYNINKSNGAAVVVPTGGIDNQFDIPLLGQDAINYGDDLATGQLHLLENFANSTAPSFGANRTIGQLWYDTTGGQGLKIWDGGTWDLLPLDTNVVHLTDAESIAGVKTFTDSAAFTDAAVPFTVNSTTLVTNLNAQLFNGQADTAFADAAQGALADTAAQLPANAAGVGFILSADLSNNYTWISPASGTGNVDPIDASGDTTTTLLLYSESTASGALQPLIDEGGLTYDAGSNTLTTTTFSGSLDGNAATATIAVTATTATTATQIAVADTADATTNVVLVSDPTGNRAPLTDGALTYNASSGALAAISFVGVGTSLTALTAANITAGVLAVNRGGTGVQVSSGSGAQFVLYDSPTFLNEITVPKIANSGAVIIEWNNVDQIQTQEHEATGNTTGGQVKDHAGTFQDIGFNTLPIFNWDADDILEARHCGHTTGTSDGGTWTLTIDATGNTDFPIGGVTTIINGGATDYTITEGSGTTLFYMEAGVGGTDTTGGCVLGAGGVATLYRFDATDYFIWGSEITP